MNGEPCLDPDMRAKMTCIIIVSIGEGLGTGLFKKALVIETYTIQKNGGNYSIVWQKL